MIVVSGRFLVWIDPLCTSFIIIGMGNLSPFARNVLDALTDDEKLKNEILHPQGIRPVSKAQCMQDFVRRIEQAKENGEKVLVAGDYDCDGMMSTSILFQALKAKGIECGYYIPNRLKEGYGLSANTVQMAHDKGYSLIVTVDNGVKAKDALAKAKELGVDVIVTDHHLISDPVDASILVHPTLMEEDFSSLCGAGLAYECARAIGVDQERFLIWAAIASVADCMEVIGETRSIIQKGLEALNTNGEPHNRALCSQIPLDESHVGFQIAPKINAIGRLADQANPNTFVRFLENDQPAVINSYARQLESLNEKRKELSRVVSMKASLEANPLWPVLVAADESFHEGVVGLAAGSLSHQTGKPAIVGTVGEDQVKCSMRAPEGFHCLEFLEGFDGYLALGGHAQAAGFSVAKDRWADFEQFVLEKGRKIKWRPTEAQVIELDPDQATVDNIRSLDALRPFGTGLPAPRFALMEPDILNTFDLSQGKHRKYTLSDGLQVLNFNQSSMEAAAAPADIEEFIGTLSISTFRNKETPQFIADQVVLKED